jgi:hypothetical protein
MLLQDYEAFMKILTSYGDQFQPHQNNCVDDKLKSRHGEGMSRWIDQEIQALQPEVVGKQDQGMRCRPESLTEIKLYFSDER